MTAMRHRCYTYPEVCAKPDSSVPLPQLIFASAFHKLVGKRVLFAQGFHCTGMPIKVWRQLPSIMQGLLVHWHLKDSEPSAIILCGLSA